MYRTAEGDALKVSELKVTLDYMKRAGLRHDIITPQEK